MKTSSKKKLKKERKLAFREIGLVLALEGDDPSEPSAVVDLQYGSPAQVEFDFMRVWEYYKNYPETKLIFVHSHNNLPAASSTDWNCMKGFASIFREFVFSIASFNEDDRVDIIAFHYKDGKFSEEHKRDFSLEQNDWIFNTLERLSFGG